jgi:hypothetical protein
LRIYVGAGLEKKVHNIEPPIARCKAQRCLSILVRLVNVSAVLDEKLGHEEMAFGGCKKKRDTEALFA